MKRIFILFLFSLSISTTGTTRDFFNLANDFFKAYVDNGRVAYANIKAEPEQLNVLINQIATFDLVNKSEATQVAFMINAYNILAIKGIINDYPVKSPMSIKDFFDKKAYVFAGVRMSLNQLEKEQLYPLAKDPRLHFVLVCAAISCPKLASFAYTPDKLNEQLDDITRKNLNDPEFVQISDKKFRLSEIFNWYAGDFSTKEKGVIEFINQYRESQLDTKGAIRYYSYNWDLNDQI